MAVAKVRGEFVWHAHPETDDSFLVLQGTLVIDLEDGWVELGPGDPTPEQEIYSITRSGSSA